MGEATERIERALRDMIDRGDYKPGSKLPSERSLAEEYRLSRTTVRLVLTKLTAQGVIEAQHGRGYFVQPAARARRATKASGR